MMCDAEELSDLVLVNMGTDDAEAADDGSGTGTDIGFAGNIIEMDPLAVLARDNSLSAENDAVLEDVLKLV